MDVLFLGIGAVCLSIGAMINISTRNKLEKRIEALGTKIYHPDRP